MVKSTPLSDAIWNRATERLPPDAPRGDRALGDALELHGLVMNGGLDHGLDVMGAEGVERAAAGWDYLGRDDVGALLREALGGVADMPEDRGERAEYFIDGWTEAQAEAIQDLDARYPDDGDLEEAFLRRLAEHPEDFAPIET